MARLQVRGSVVSIFEGVARQMDVLGVDIDIETITREFSDGFNRSNAGQSPRALGASVAPDEAGAATDNVKPQWLMSQLADHRAQVAAPAQ